jgi:hypothetical protein
MLKKNCEYRNEHQSCGLQPSKTDILFRKLLFKFIFFLSFSFFLSLSFFLSHSNVFYLLVVGAEAYCCTWSHSVINAPHSVGLLWTRGRLVAPHTHNTHNGQTSMPKVRFETAFAANDRPQTHALDRTATGIGNLISRSTMYASYVFNFLEFLACSVLYSDFQILIFLQLITLKQSYYRPWQALRVPTGWGSQILRQSVHEGGKVTHRPSLPPGNIPSTHLC